MTVTQTELPPHPAKFTESILERVRPIVEAEATLLGRPIEVFDCFAGTGKIHQLASGQIRTVGVELEPEWAAYHPDTIVGDSTDLPDEWTGRFDVLVTSPAYANRMADRYAGDPSGSRRHTYRIDLGRPLSDNSGAALQWGDAYRELHEKVYREVRRVLRPASASTWGALAVVNVSDHIRQGERVPVVDWHEECLTVLGFSTIERIKVPTPRQRHGANGHLRVDHEELLVLRAPAV